MTIAPTPFADPYFHAVMASLGVKPEECRWKTTGVQVDWTAAGARGIGSDDLRDLPDGAARFRYGREEDGREYLSIWNDGSVYSRRDGEITLTILMTLPETIEGSLAGRRLREIVDMPAIGDLVVVGVTHDGNMSTGWVTLTLSEE